MMRHVHGIAIAAALCAGCLDIPAFPGDARPPDAVSADAVPCDPTNADKDGDGWRCDNTRAPDCDDGNPDINPGVIEVCGEGLDQDCSGADLDCGVTAQTMIVNGQQQVAINGYIFEYPVTNTLDGMPERLGVAGEQGLDLLSHDVEENAFGVARFPHERSNDADNGTVMRVSAPGPALARFVSTWGTTDFGGTTTISFYGDGRVARDDDVVFAEGMAQFLSTYVSFDAAHITNVAWPGGTSPRLNMFRFHWPAPLDDTTNATNGAICLYNTNTEHRIGFTWRDTGGFGPRLTEDTNRFAVEYDWVRAPMEVPYPAFPMMAPAEAQTLFHFGHVDSGMPCQSLNGLAAQYQTPPTMTSPQGVSVGYNAGHAQYEVGLAVGAFVEVVPGVGQQPGPTFTLYVTLAAPDGVTVWIDGTRLVTGADYVIQRDPDANGLDAYTILLRRPLQEGQTLRVANPGAEPPP